jgi:hypothetical protein
VLFGVPAGREGKATALSANIGAGLRSVLGAIDAKCALLLVLFNFSVVLRASGTQQVL